MTALTDGAVLGASIVVNLILPEPGSDAATWLLIGLTRSPRWIGAPDVLAVECANVLWTGVHRRRLHPDDAESQFAALKKLLALLDLRNLDPSPHRRGGLREGSTSPCTTPLMSRSPRFRECLW